MSNTDLYTGRWVDGKWKEWTHIRELARLKGKVKALQADNARLREALRTVKYYLLHNKEISEETYIFFKDIIRQALKK